MIQTFFLAADLKTGKIYRGEPEKGVKADTTLTIDDLDMIDLVSMFSHGVDEITSVLWFGVEM